MTVADFQKQYLKALDEVDRAGKALRRAEAQNEKAWENLRRWSRGRFEEMAKAMLPFFPGRRFEVLGPFGICCEWCIHFYREGIEEDKKFEGDNCLSISFLPGEGGDLRVRDYNRNTGKFAKGTLGEVNGMNHPSIDIPGDMEIEELVKYVR
jgi:hypothetical protein